MAELNLTKTEESEWNRILDSVGSNRSQKDVMKFKIRKEKSENSLS